MSIGIQSNSTAKIDIRTKHSRNPKTEKIIYNNFIKKNLYLFSIAATTESFWASNGGAVCNVKI